MHNSSRNSATIIRKFRDQGSKFSNETQRGCLRPMLLFWKSYPKRTLIHLRKNGERLPHSSMHNSSRNSATIIRKFRDQGSKFSNETQRGCLRPMLLFWKSYPKRTLIHLRKNGERLPHSSMHNSSRNSATIIRKFRDQGSKFSQETEGLLASYATIKEVQS